MELLRKINIKRAITHNLWLKLISLVIAIFIWFYVSEEIIRGIRI